MLHLCGYWRNCSFLITIVMSPVCVNVCLRRELIIPSLGVDYSNL